MAVTSSNCSRCLGLGWVMGHFWCTDSAWHPMLQDPNRKAACSHVGVGSPPAHGGLPTPGSHGLPTLLPAGTFLPHPRPAPFPLPLLCPVCCPHHSHLIRVSVPTHLPFATCQPGSSPGASEPCFLPCPLRGSVPLKKQRWGHSSLVPSTLRTNDSPALLSGPVPHHFREDSSGREREEGRVVVFWDPCGGAVSSLRSGLWGCSGALACRVRVWDQHRSGSQQTQAPLQETDGVSKTKPVQDPEVPRFKMRSRPQ